MVISVAVPTTLRYLLCRAIRKPLFPSACPQPRDKTALDEATRGIRRYQRQNVAIDSGIDIAQGRLMREVPSTSLASGALIEAFAPLAEWEFGNRDQKRTVLATLTPDIRVADYKVESLGLNPALFSNEDTRTAAGTFIAESPLVYLPLPAA
jgi:hypothetical protein